MPPSRRTSTTATRSSSRGSRTSSASPPATRSSGRPHEPHARPTHPGSDLRPDDRRRVRPQARVLVGGNPGVGSLHAFRRAVEGENGPRLELEEYSHFGMVARFAAGAARLPFLPPRDYMGTDLPAANPPIRSGAGPHTRERPPAGPGAEPHRAGSGRGRVGEEGWTWGAPDYLKKKK